MCNELCGEDFEVFAELHGEAPAAADGEGDPACGGFQEPAGGQLLSRQIGEGPADRSAGSIPRDFSVIIS